MPLWMYRLVSVPRKSRPPHSSDNQPRHDAFALCCYGWTRSNSKAFARHGRSTRSRHVGLYADSFGMLAQQEFGHRSVCRIRQCTRPIWIYPADVCRPNAPTRLCAKAHSIGGSFECIKCLWKDCLDDCVQGLFERQFLGSRLFICRAQSRGTPCHLVAHRAWCRYIGRLRGQDRHGYIVRLDATRTIDCFHAENGRTILAF